MGWFKMILGIKEKPEEIAAEVAQQQFQQPRGNLIGQCLFCQLAIGDEDRYMKLPKPEGALAHKRCIKKSQQMIFQGVNPEEISRRLNGTNSVE